jgi:isopenicillin-N N-acyltransferase-like protein
LLDPFPFIKVSGSAHECGVKYGKAAKKQIRYNVDYYIGLWGRICGMTEKEALKKASSTAEPIRKYDAGIYEEIEGIAEGSDSKLEEILALNTRYELLFSQVKLAPGECTALAALPDATTVGHTLLAQNWDYRPGIKDGCVTLEVKQEGKPSILLHAEAGTVGHKGVNSHGLGIVVNALVSDKDSFTPYPPLLVQCRKALNSKGLNEAMFSVLNAKRSVSSNLILAQAGGVAVDLEMSPLDTSIMVPENGYIAHTNHFIGPRSLSVQDTFVSQIPNTVYRLSRTNATLRRWDSRISVDGIKEILRDHFGKPYSVCTHPDPNVVPDMQGETIASVIMDLDERSLHITRGPPCLSEYEKYTLS